MASVPQVEDERKKAITTASILGYLQISTYNLDDPDDPNLELEMLYRDEVARHRTVAVVVSPETDGSWTVSASYPDRQLGGHHTEWRQRIVSIYESWKGPDSRLYLDSEEVTMEHIPRTTWQIELLALELREAAGFGGDEDD